jgi:predicted MPP superfamily phosphohydrolase
MKLAWSTDIHLDFLNHMQQKDFAERLANSGADAFLIGGDISKASSIEQHLCGLESRLSRPIFFVLGNHDFYGGSITTVRDAMQKISSSSGWLKWLPAVGVVPLTMTTALVGHDGWGDARLGNFETTPIELNDFLLIKELSGLGRPERNRKLRELGDQAAAHLGNVLPAALARFQKVIVLTHVPPFSDACWHQGGISEADWLPYFTCAAAGNVLLDQASKHPDRELLVFCGHTHGAGEVRLLPNLYVRTGGADYGESRIEGMVNC